MLLSILLVSVASVWALPALAWAGPQLTLDVHHGQTNAVPGGSPGGGAVTTEVGGSASSDEQQLIDVYATTGQFRLSFGPDLTSPLPYNATGAQVQAALRALPSIGSPNLTVTEIDNNPALSSSYEVTFTGALADTDVPPLTLSDGPIRLGVGPEYWFEVVNVGDAPTSGPLTLTVQLPAGIRRHTVYKDSNADFTDWSCPGAFNDATVTCTTSDPIPRHDDSSSLALIVELDPNLVPPTTRTVRATLSGGGAPAAPPAAACSGSVAACASDLTRIEAAEAPFAILPETFLPDFTAADAVTPFRQAGGHPDLFSVPLDFTTVAEPGGSRTKNVPNAKDASEPLRDLAVDLPPGFLGDPTVVGTCSPAELADTACPPSSQVGVARVLTRYIFGTFSADATVSAHYRPVFNMESPKGAVADLAFTVLGNPVHIRASLDPARNYAITSAVSDLNETIPVFASDVVLWGVPADPAHDSQRCATPEFRLDTSAACPAGLPQKPFITVPFQCDQPMSMTLRDYDSWDHPGAFGPDITREIGTFENCAAPQAEFNPTATITPTSPRADSPTGLDVTATVPFNKDPDGLATPPVKRLSVTLPEGMAVNPAFADGLRGCTEAEIGITHSGVPDDAKVTCPDASRIGSVDLSTPLLPDAPDPATDPRCSDGGAPLQGSIYLAEQGLGNPTEELFAIYTVVHDCQDSGVIVKLPGSMQLDPDTGQITTVFEDLPQFPFDSLSVKFRSGDRAPLVNPPTCGTKEITGNLNTWTEPATDVPISDSYTIDAGPGGGSCSPDLASRPFDPVFKAGPQNPQAGAFSPFVLKLTRGDGEQEITKLSADLPPGMVGKLAGVAQCSDATLNAIPTDPGTGLGELDHPSCPQSSQVGYTNVGIGAGPRPFYQHGSVYLAGPYKGAPLSLAIVTPAVTGTHDQNGDFQVGLDLGNVVIRTALYVDEDDAQLHAVSDQIPAIFQGVPLHVRDIRVVMDRGQFTLNPTNCDPMQVTAQIGGAGGSTDLNDASDDVSVPVSDPFKVDGCQNLGFSPKLSGAILNGRDGIHRSDHPNLSFNLHGSPFPGSANLKSVAVTLPQAFQIDQANLGNICSETQLANEECAGRNTVGTASATTPLLDQPLSGPVYAVSGSGGLPKLAVILHGPPELPIKLVVRGITETVGARIKNTFPAAPDAPINDFTLTLNGGPGGYLVNNTNVCGASSKGKKKGRRAAAARKRKKGKKGKNAKSLLTADAFYTAHDGDTLSQRVPISAQCPKAKKKARKRHH